MIRSSENARDTRLEEMRVHAAAKRKASRVLLVASSRREGVPETESGARDPDEALSDYRPPCCVAREPMSLQERDELLVQLVVRHVPVNKTWGWRTVRVFFHQLTGFDVRRQALEQRVEQLYKVSRNIASPDYMRLSETLLDSLDEFHRAREHARDEALLQAALAVRRSLRWDGVTDEWRQIADRYNQRMATVDPAHRQSRRQLKERIEYLRGVYVDEMVHAQSGGSRGMYKVSERLSVHLQGLIEEYLYGPGMEWSNINRVKVEKEARQRCERNSEVAKLDVEKDTRMLRIVLDGCFSIREASQVSFGAAAEFRGTDWTAEDVEIQIDWLWDTYELPSSSHHAELVAHKPLCVMLEDYKECIPRMWGYLANMNRVGSAQGLDTANFDDLLLEKVLQAQPFTKKTSRAESLAWERVAIHLNAIILAKAVFKRELCAARFSWLRKVTLGIVTTAKIKLTRTQRRMLVQAEEMIEGPRNDPEIAEDACEDSSTASNTVDSTLEAHLPGNSDGPDEKPKQLESATVENREASNRAAVLNLQALLQHSDHALEEKPARLESISAGGQNQAASTCNDENAVSQCHERALVRRCDPHHNQPQLLKRNREELDRNPEIAANEQPEKAISETVFDAYVAETNKKIKLLVEQVTILSGQLETTRSELIAERHARKQFEETTAQRLQAAGRLLSTIGNEMASSGR